MRKICLVGGILLCASVLLAAGDITLLNVKTGQWETTTTNAVSGSAGIPPDVAARLTPDQLAKVEAAMKNMPNQVPKTRTYKSCLTKEQLTKDPFEDDDQRKANCSEMVTKSTKSAMEVHVVCMEGTTKTDANISVQATDSEHATGTGQISITMGGHTMNSNMNFTARWLGATCPDDK